MAKSVFEKIKFFPFSPLVFIFLVALFLRLTLLGSYPPELHSNEALLGWRAESLLSLGKDETGRTLPLFFSSLNGYQLPLSSYFLVPFIYFFGLHQFAVRLPFALMGALAVLAMYGISCLLFPKEKKIAFWSALVMAISPWTVFLSRNSSSTNLSFSFFIIGFFFFLLGHKKKLGFTFLGIIFLFVSLFTAKVSWFFVLPFLIWTEFFYFRACEYSAFSWAKMKQARKDGRSAKEILSFHERGRCHFGKEKRRLLSIGLLLISLIFLIISYLKVPQYRLDLLSYDFNIFSDPGIKAGINAMRGESIQSKFPFLGRVFYNKFNYLLIIGGNFLRHFNPRFFFASGDRNLFHGLTNYGPILLAFLPLCLSGIGLIFKYERRLLVFLFGWLVLATLPSVFVIPSPDQEKAIFLLPVLAVLIAYGLSQVKKIYLKLFLILLVFNCAIVLFDAIIKEPSRFQEERQIGYQELAGYIKENWNRYQKIYLTDAYGKDPGPSLLFYLNYPAENFIPLQKSELTNRNWIKQVGKVTIDQKDSWNNEMGSLYIVTPKDKDDMPVKYRQIYQYKKIHTINDLEGRTVFEFFEY